MSRDKRNGTGAMPQIWMTYNELGSLLGCEPLQARAMAIAQHLDRKKSRDGNSRVKLGPDWTSIFISKIRMDDRFDRVSKELDELPHLKTKNPERADEAA
jgi:hypothetical protein